MKPIHNPMLHSISDIADAILRGDRTTLSRAITLVESNHPRHVDKAQELIGLLLPYAGNSIRIGITGVPGVGKSTFIDAFGMQICNNGKKVAVLAVDPTSAVSGGSILGDKTRMDALSRHPSAYIRPSPASGTLGGVHRSTRESILLLEAAGFDTILVETVGVGQSEVAVRTMTDFFLLLMLAGAGDELQGIKKGITELADAIAITKADGNNVIAAKAARVEYERALHYFGSYSAGWRRAVLTCSAVTGDGIQAVWDTIAEFEASRRANGELQALRAAQQVEWFRTMFAERVMAQVKQHPLIAASLADTENRVRAGTLPVTTAVNSLIHNIFPH